MEKTGIYEQFSDAAKRHGKTLSNVLRTLKMSTGSMGNWKRGQYPRLDVAMEIAEYLGMSLDDLVYGFGKSKSSILTNNQREWLYIIDNIPSNKQDMCKDFLRTHAMIPRRYREETS